MKQIRINIIASIFVDKSDVNMYHILTGEVKSLDQIDRSDENWILEDTVATMEKATELEWDKIEFEEIEE